MSKNRELELSYGKLLDAWTAPTQAGEPVGCVATSFTFDAAFFEEECLSRFLRMGTDATEDGPAYLIEREEKLAQVVCAAALVDQFHARGMRSLRWDLLAARLPHGILHAKISLLLWSNHARLVIGSANLTNDGYRRNQEIFGVLDYFPSSPAPLSCLSAIIDFLEEASTYSVPTALGASPALLRWNALLQRVRKQCDHWGVSALPRGRSGVQVVPVLVGPQRPNAFETLRKIWPDATPADAAWVVSPFFDPPEAPNEPARELWKTLRQRGPTEVNFEVVAQEVPGEKTLVVHAPQSLQVVQPARTLAVTQFNKLQLENTRPLHAKTLWLQNERCVLYMLGSSNFTSPGLGMGQTRNLEANLAYLVNSRSAQAYHELECAHLLDEPIGSEWKIVWKPPPEAGEDAPPPGALPLPAFFGDASFDVKYDVARLTFAFCGAPPAGWSLLAEDSDELFVDEARWREEKAPCRWQVPWPHRRPPSGFSVSWEGAAGTAWWPVNATSGAALPPPEELKDLPLEVLVALLTSARPLYEIVRKLCQKQQSSSIEFLNPHDRVDTSSFLLQRTRRVSWALKGLRDRLEKPIVSLQSLEWRVNGPIGARALSEAILREARTEAERAFLLAELALELSRVRPAARHDCLPPTEVRAALNDLINDLQSKIEMSVFDQTPGLQSYTESAFKEALR